MPFEKNFANISIKTIFIGSDGPIKNDPRLNHLLPPFDIWPIAKISIRAKIKIV